LGICKTERPSNKFIIIYRYRSQGSSTEMPEAGGNHYIDFSSYVVRIVSHIAAFEAAGPVYNVIKLGWPQYGPSRSRILASGRTGWNKYKLVAGWAISPRESISIL
jgi:hypothetical protein